MERPFSPPLIVLETTVLSLGRLGLFFACRRLLHSLYHDLQTLASSAKLSAGTTEEEEPLAADIELDALPTPSTSSTSRTGGEKRTGNRALVHSMIARTSFSLCFSESCTMLVVFMCQEIGIFSPRSRLMNWTFSLYVLLAMILLVIPLSQNFLLTYQSPLQLVSRIKSLPGHLLVALVPYSAYLFAVSLIPLPAGHAPESAFDEALSRLIVLGTFTIGLLSGLGAVWNAWDFLPALSKKSRKVPTEREMATAEDALQRVRNDLAERHAERRRLLAAKSDEPTSWVSRVMPSFGEDPASALQREIDGLEALEYQMSRNMESLRQLKGKAEFARTWKGRCFQVLGRIFALYCIVRTVSCIFNILAGYRSTKLTEAPEETKSYPDIVAHLLAYAFSLLPTVHLSDETIAALSRQISLLLVGLIILSSVRFVLRAVTRILRLTSQNLGASLLLLILAQLMGTYLISTLVQLRTAFPPPAVPPNTEPVNPNVLATLPAYEMFGSLFDWSYLIAAIVTAAYLWVDEKINGATTDV